MFIIYFLCVCFELVLKYVYCISDIMLYVYVIFFMLFFFMILVVLDDCDFIWSFRDGRCYKLFMLEVIWFNVLKICQVNLVNLVNIVDFGENVFVYGNFLVIY